MFWKTDTFQDRSSKWRDDEPRDGFARSQPHPAHSSEESPMNIGKTVVIKGELTSTEDTVILGRLEGTITVKDHTVTIGKGATIEAEVKGHSVVVEGHVTGNVTASKSLEIGVGGMVLGDVSTPSLVIRDGGTLKGRVDMDADGPTSKKQDESLPVDDKSSPVERDREKVSVT
jgi:cytoskeletal protein CcmA (bactofilin family)